MCVTNVQVVVAGWNDAAYCKVINEGDLVIPDLLPLVFGLRALAILPANQRKKNQEEEFYLKVRGRECEEYTFQTAENAALLNQPLTDRADSRCHSKHTQRRLIGC